MDRSQEAFSKSSRQSQQATPGTCKWFGMDWDLMGWVLGFLSGVALGATLVGVAQAIIIITPTKPVEQTTKCQIYWRKHSWALEDCVCRVYQNDCLMREENDKREKAGKTPLIPVSEKVCKKFIKAKCLLGWPVVAKFPVPSPCGCNGKPGSLEIKKFKSLCELQKYAAECSKPYISYSKC
ncbi:salivary glue protein Sgs-5 [Drosophila eugracilis]|uniref:salivary glue protein Sgs-5 n=1 Tax=Drosophila eugracilis TaxID=29029 RepID=UPI0007E8AF68|nr:salivary glue protein Sgs-5 [Drosophila eugracilis]